jgi:hypothetical protein
MGGTLNWPERCFPIVADTLAPPLMCRRCGATHRVGLVVVSQDTTGHAIAMVMPIPAHWLLSLAGAWLLDCAGWRLSVVRLGLGWAIKTKRVL